MIADGPPDGMHREQDACRGPEGDRHRECSAYKSAYVKPSQITTAMHERRLQQHPRQLWSARGRTNRSKRYASDCRRGGPASDVRGVTKTQNQKTTHLCPQSRQMDLHL